MKKICVVTSARSEYGLLRYLMKKIDKAIDLELQVVVTGGHLLDEQGHTIDQIYQDRIKISSIVECDLDYTTQEAVSASMGRMAEGFSHVLAKLSPDFLIVLGDRYELLPICSSAFVMKIPIIHISGGDITEGSLDNGIRNAITMLAEYHFPGTEESANNIIRMRGSSKNVWVVGEPGLDVFNNEDLLSRQALSDLFGLNINTKWIIMTYHAETTSEMEDNIRTVKNCCKALQDTEDIQVVMTYANADFGGKHINDYISTFAKQNNEKFKCYPSLGSLRYISMMKEASCIIGNSSSGIVEAPSLKIPVINIGSRQSGRHLCSNIISCGKSYDDIIVALNKALNCEVDDSDLLFWGDGNTADRIFTIIRGL
ncbi:GDP/UDP-N,N'-diacetylbacillosamine 2-epimerase (hydrolysing) [Lachnospiraceae bacterium NE2001]|nr:GDP/UDP-N,N'-diacetylbacillosamine 2-epimerase (hydrolysing) [Lachnospiraceae bacterium NE2001]